MTQRMKVREILQSRTYFKCEDYNLSDADELIKAFEEAGLAIVPIEPTEKMVEAGFQHTGDPCWHEDVARAYRAMLAAAKEGE